VALPRSLRRRTAGLRREEVAILAGLSATWTTWLEQGRAIWVSAPMLTAASRALRLTRDERAYLYLLGEALGPPSADCGVLLFLLPCRETLYSIASHFASNQRGTFMATDLQTKKFSYIFTWFDQTGDGWLTRDDFEKIAGLFTALTDENDQKNKVAMKKAFMHWWDLLLKSSEGTPGEKIGKEEFVRIMSSIIIAPENFENAVGGIVDALVAVLDRDGNGSLSQEEYVRMYDAVGVPPASSAEWFKRLDLDGSGELSYAEFRQCLLDFYLSADPNAPGNWLLGAMDAPA
jgi:Ca2+-binding EF-hand superfamily protein